MNWNPRTVDWNEPCVNRLHFIGTYNPKVDYSYGDVIERDGQICVCIGYNRFEIISTTEETHERHEEHVEEEIIFQCRNCGAPTHENGKCPYCGTINRKVKRYVR